MTKVTAMIKHPSPQPFSAPAHPRVRKLKYLAARSVSALIIREMSSTYGRSPGGYFWAVAQPVALIFVLTLAFSLLVRNPPLGTNFALFYATGILPLRMFQMLSNNIGAALQYNKALLAYPRVTFVDAVLARGILVVLTQFLVSAVILMGISVWFDSSEVLDLHRILEAYSLTILLGFGVGLLNCFLFMWLPFWRVVWGIATGPLILFSAVIYIVEELPLFAQKILWYNPLVHVTGLMRMGFYSTYNAAYISPVYVLLFALVPAFFGVLTLRSFGRTVLYH